MDFDNKTPFPAELVRTVLNEDMFYAIVVARVTFEKRGDQLVPAAEQKWKVSLGPQDTPYGPMEGDNYLVKGEGTDLHLFGSCYGDGGRQVQSQLVGVAVGNTFRRSFMVFGNRVWRRQGEALTPSDPAPFRSIPMTLANAYGGSDVWDELNIGYAGNPIGKGFIYAIETAVGKPLPNIEHPDRLIKNWDDRPEPAGTGFCPQHHPGRLRNGAEGDPATGSPAKIKPEMFNTAFPELIAPPLKAGEVISVTGMHERGPQRIIVPNLPLMVRVSFDNKSTEHPLRMQQIGWEIEKERVFVTYRFQFRYAFVPMQLRSCELFKR